MSAEDKSSSDTINYQNLTNVEKIEIKKKLTAELLDSNNIGDSDSMLVLRNIYTCCACCGLYNKDNENKNKNINEYFRVIEKNITNISDIFRNTKNTDKEIVEIYRTVIGYKQSPEEIITEEFKYHEFSIALFDYVKTEIKFFDQSIYYFIVNNNLTYEQVSKLRFTINDIEIFSSIIRIIRTLDKSKGKNHMSKDESVEIWVSAIFNTLSSDNHVSIATSRKKKILNRLIDLGFDTIPLSYCTSNQ